MARSLDELQDLVANCRECGLAQGRNKVVFGEGNPRARLMLIGEGPGAEEDRLGRPFVGRAGHLLDDILASAGFKREEVFIANIVKCRPPANRAPSREEAETCLKWLRQQYLLISPSIILILGNTALKHLVDPRAAITAYRGQWIHRGRVMMMPTFHPAALLRDPAKKKDVWHDIQQVRDACQNLDLQSDR